MQALRDYESRLRVHYASERQAQDVREMQVLGFYAFLTRPPA